MEPFRKQSTTLIIGGLLIVLAIATAVVWFARHSDSNNANSQSTEQEQSGSQNAGDSAANEGVYRGELACLPHKDADGPQTLECALGLKTADGSYYGLAEKESTGMVASLPMGTKITVTGSLKKGDDKIYRSKGVITFTKAATDN